MPSSRAPFPRIPPSHTVRLKVVADRARCRCRRSQQSNCPKSDFGHKDGNPSAADGQARPHGSGRTQNPRCSPGHFGRLGCGNWVGAQRGATRRCWHRERMGWKVRQTRRTETVCRTGPARCRTWRRKHTRHDDQNHHPFRHCDSCACGPKVLKLICEQYHRSAVPAWEHRAPAQPYRGKYSRGLALETSNDAVRPGRQGEGYLRCRR